MARERRIGSEDLNGAGRMEVEVEVNGYEVEVNCIRLKNNELSKFSKIIRRVWESANDWQQNTSKQTIADRPSAVKEMHKISK